MISLLLTPFLSLWLPINNTIVESVRYTLLISGIRPTGVPYLLFSTVIMFNQGAPYFYILYDMVIPRLSHKVKKDQVTEIELVIERKK